jgi:uncharacterized MnhB-related membrane protein
MYNYTDSTGSVRVNKDFRMDVLASKQGEINKRAARRSSSGHYRGYRIQVYNAQNRDEANTVKAEMLRPRNIFLSGYLVFPVPSTGWFDVDWKVPINVAVQEKLHVSNAPRLVSSDWKFVDSLAFTQWFPIWLKQLWVDNKFNALLTYVTFISPGYSILIFTKNKYATMYLAAYAIAVAGLIFWLLGSPDVRFGYHYMLPIVFFPLFLIASRKTLSFSGNLSNIFSIVTVLMCCYYCFIAIKMLAPSPVKQYVVKPLRSAEYLSNNDLASFNFVTLNDSVKLFFHDSTHHTLNAPLPSSDKYRKGIGMRGATLQEGFRINNDSMHVR